MSVTETPPPRKHRSGSRAPVNPRTKAQRLVRARELTERMDARLAEVEQMGQERNRIVGELRTIDGATFREIAQAVGKSEQAIHKAFQKVGHGANGTQEAP